MVVIIITQLVSACEVVRVFFVSSGCRAVNLLIKESLVGCEEAVSFLGGVQRGRFRLAVVVLVKIFPFCSVNLFLNSLALAIEVHCRVFFPPGLIPSIFNYLARKQTDKQTKNCFVPQEDDGGNFQTGSWSTDPLTRVIAGNALEKKDTSDLGFFWSPHQAPTELWGLLNAAFVYNGNTAQLKHSANF